MTEDKNNKENNNHMENNKNGNNQKPKENYDFLFNDDEDEQETNPFHNENDKEKMIEKFKQKIRELRERENELNNTFKNRQNLFNSNNQFMKAFQQNMMKDNNLKSQHENMENDKINMNINMNKMNKNDNGNNINDNKGNKGNSGNQKPKENFDFLFTEEKNDAKNFYNELDKEKMMEKIKQKIKEIKEREEELHTKFKNGYIPLNTNEKTEYINNLYQNIINIDNLKSKVSSAKMENEKKNMNNNPGNNNKNKYDKEEDNSIDEDVTFMGKVILRMGKYVKYFIEFLNVILGTAFFLVAIFYFTGVHFNAFGNNGHGIYKDELPSLRNKNSYIKQYYKGEEFKGFSLLMTPDRNSETYKILNRTVTELSQDYHTELFEPHLTLYAPIDMPLADLKKKLMSLSIMEPFELSMNNVITGNKYYQCVLGTVELTSDLRYVYRRTVELLGLPNNNYFPHISLIYGNFHNFIKKRILKEVLYEKNYTNYLPLKFTISQIEIWKTEGETRTWKCHDTIPFTTDDSDDDDDEY